MYLRILKKDLKRKLTMNIILFIFITLATMFIASSVSNILAIVGGTDHFMDIAGVPDILVAGIDQEGVPDIADALDSLSEIDHYEIQPITILTPENLLKDGREMTDMEGSGLFQPFTDLEMRFFDQNDQPITGVMPGTVWLSVGTMNGLDIQEGDRLEITYGDISRELTVAGCLKDASCIGNRFLVDSSDYDCFSSVPNQLRGSIYHIYTGDPTAVMTAFNQDSNSIIFMADKARMATGFIMGMVVAGILMVVSICLILIAFVVLRFTISFALAEEYRQIGVMKAIGLSNCPIRLLYIVKYMLIAILGATAGFLLSIPFGSILLQSVSETMILASSGSFWINAFCALAVVAVSVGFSYGCTRKVKTLTPMDAIRSGSTGERFQNKSLLRVGKTPGKPASFMAANDVLSSPRRYISVILVFTLCLLLVLILVNSTNTLKSDSLISAFNMVNPHLFFADSESSITIIEENGKEKALAALDTMEQTLDQQGMPSKCSTEVQFTLTLAHGDKTLKTRVFQGIGTTADQYDYYKGTAPQNSNELAITQTVAQTLDVDIGDTVTVRLMEGDRDFIVTALFQSLMNMGDSARFHEDTPVDFRQVSSFYAYQIQFTDNPDQAEILRRKDILLDLYEDNKVWTAAEYVEDMVGFADTIDAIKNLVLLVSLVIIALITVLMERSFITKERGEIAILKALGFRNGTVVLWHTLRFGIVAALSTLLALALQMHMTELTVGPIFTMMGADFGIQYEIVPLQIFVIYPALVLAVTMLSAFLTAQYTRAIQTNECSNID